MLAEGHHILRLRNAAGKLVALTIVTQAGLERAAAFAAMWPGMNLRREGWASAPQWKRWIKTEVGQLIDQIAKGKARCDLRRLRRKLDERTRIMQSIAIMPCRFDHRNDEAVEAALTAVRPVLSLLLRNGNGGRHTGGSLQSQQHPDRARLLGTYPPEALEPP